MLTNVVRNACRRHVPLFSFSRFVSHCAENPTNENNGHYDVIIVGGGGAGISLAGAIGKNTINHRMKKIQRSFGVIIPNSNCSKKSNAK